jgi:uncharacterized protein (DUF1778 family)
MKTATKIEQSRADDRIYVRLNSQLKQHIQHAADLRGLDLTAYVLSTLVADADKTVKEHEVMELSRRDREAFAKAILNPPAPNKHLLAAARRYKKNTAR